MVSQIPIPVTRSWLARIDPQIKGHTVRSIINDTPDNAIAMAAICHEPAMAKTNALIMLTVIVINMTFLMPILSARTPIGIASTVLMMPLRLPMNPRIRGEAPRLLMYMLWYWYVRFTAERWARFFQMFTLNGLS